jgi:hypothetical protein
MPECLQVIFSIAGVTVSVSAILFTFLQWKLATRKFRFELFDRRMQAKEAIFGVADSFINETAHPRSKAWGDFYRHAYLCRTLFPPIAADWILALYRKVYQLWFVLEPSLKIATDSPVVGNAEIDRIHSERMELRQSIGNLYEETEKWLDPHLRLF